MAHSIADRLRLFNEIVGRFDDSIALLAARELGVFEGLLEGSLTPEQLAERCGVAERRLRQLLDLIVALGFLARKGNRYGLVPGDEAFFDSRGRWPEALGFADFRDFFEGRARTVDVLRSDRPLEAAGVGAATDIAKREHFLRYLHQRSLAGADEVAEALASPSVRRIVDLGSGLGTYSVALLRLCPDATALLFDRPNAGNAVRAYLEEQGLSDRAEFIGGDVLTDDFGADHDLALLSNFVHCLGPEQNQALLHRVAAALGKGGRVAVKDLGVSSDRTSPLSAVRFGFNMALMSDRGNVYPKETVSRWLYNAGLTHQHEVPLVRAGGSYLVVGGRERVRRKTEHQLAPSIRRRRGMRFVVLGAGIGGLACGIALRRAGFHVEIYERARAADRTGLGFIVMNNGLTALDRLGLGESARRLGCPIRRATIRDPRGDLVTEEEVPEALAMRRADLLELLAAALPPDVVRRGMAFSSFDAGDDGMVRAACFSDGTFAEGDVFIGADGVRSRARRALYPDAEINPVRIKELVNVCHAPEIATALGGGFLKLIDPTCGLAVGVVPCGYGRVVWFIQYDSELRDIYDRSTGAKTAFAYETAGDWPDPIPTLMAATDFSHGHIWRTTDMDMLPSYYRGNAVLIGDAAHTLLTFTSQGVGTALEDALALTESVTASQKAGLPIADAFAACDHARRGQVRRYLDAGRDLSERFLHPTRYNDGARIPLAQ